MKKIIILISSLIMFLSCSKDSGGLIPKELTDYQTGILETQLLLETGSNFELFEKYIEPEKIDGLMSFINFHKIDVDLSKDQITNLLKSNEGKFLLYSILVNQLILKYSTNIKMDCFTVQTKESNNKCFFFLAHLNCDSSFKLSSSDVTIEYELGLPYVETRLLEQVDTLIFDYSFNGFKNKYKYYPKRDNAPTGRSQN